MGRSNIRRGMKSSFVAATLGVALAGNVPIATFDGVSGTTWPWETVNDPVMGGQSKSAFQVDKTNKLGIWQGEVKIVPFLRAAGFCNLQAPGLSKTAAFPDVSGSSGFVVRALAKSGGLSKFNVQLSTKGAKHFFKQGVYMANFTLTDKMEDQTVPWEAFTCSWRGQKVDWCPDLKTELATVTNIGVGTAFPGTAAPFEVHLESISAAATQSTSTGSSDGVELATFDGQDKQSTHKWKTENDPVMGGKSESTFVVKEGLGDFSGTCRIVPKLQAPGFTIVMTESPLMGHFPDVSSQDGLMLGIRNVGGNITDFKVAFCDARINLFTCQFASYKADFTVQPSSDITEVFVPWSKFSNKWSSSTGKHTAENPPSASTLKGITQLQIWVEGVAGDFHLQIKHIRAGKPSAGQGILLV